MLTLRLNQKEYVEIVTKSGEVIKIELSRSCLIQPQIVLFADKDIKITRIKKQEGVRNED